MYRTPQRQIKNVDKVRRRLVFEDNNIQALYSEKVVPKNIDIEQSCASMASAYVEANRTEFVIFFLGYRDPQAKAEDPYFCARCIDSAVQVCITEENETKYICTGEKRYDQFTRDQYRDQSNYCGSCNVALFELKQNIKPIGEGCLTPRKRQSSVISNRQRKRFNKNRRYGPRAGGTSRPN
jgi:hypothetical protein